MHKRLTVKSIAASLTVLTFAAGCSTNNDLPEEVKKQRGTTTSTVLTDKLTNKTQKEPDLRIRSERAKPEANLQELESYADTAEAAAHLPQPAAEASIVQQLHTPRVILPDNIRPKRINTEKYQSITANPVINVSDEATSTFSIDVDTGAYANTRRFLNAGQLPPTDGVRVEELLNYFSYNYEAPTSAQTPFSIHTELSGTPWNSNTRLLHIGLKGFEVAAESRPAANLVFLIDVSGSMSDANKLGLLKSSINMLSSQLTENDRVSIVVYAGASGVVLEPTPGNNTAVIRRALKQLNAGGSTNGEAGIELAYDMAEKSMSEDSINRIILATDGDFNVGINDINKLKQLIEQKRESGIALTTLGFGTGNYNDYLMEQLADVGNGSYAYIDTLNEARKVLNEELTATLMTIAKDVKIQIEFNPAQVSEYRLIGYVNRKLANEDFANDNIDAGEIGAGHTVTALYEVALKGENGEWNSKSRYQENTETTERENEIAIVRLRYKQPDGNKSTLTEKVISRNSLIANISNASDNFRFSAAVAGFGQLLRKNKYLVEFNYADSSELANSAKGSDPYGYRAEFVQLVRLAGSLDQQARASVKNNAQDKEG